jgi:membrane protease YdiL (CAAX protease family)
MGERRMGTAISSPPPISSTTRFALLVVAMLLPSFMAALYFVILSGGNGKPNLWQSVAYGVGKTILLAFPVLFVLLVDRRFPLPKRPRFAGLGWGVAFGVAVAGGILALYYGWLADTWLFTDTGKMVRDKVAEFHMLSPGRYVVLSVAIIAVHSLVEEYYWRWFVFAQLNRLVRLPLAMALSSLAFMGHHILVLNVYFPGRFWIAAIPFSLGVAVGGAFWAWLFSRTQTIYPSWLSHAFVDAAIFLIGWDLLRVYW